MHVSRLPTIDFRTRPWMLVAMGCVLAAPAERLAAEPPPQAGDEAAYLEPLNAPDLSILSPAEWDQVDRSINRALAYLADQQQRDGSFPALNTGQPAITSLCIMAFLANGHTPGTGPYGSQLDRACNYVVRCQRESGVIAVPARGGPEISRSYSHPVGKAVAYNHAISALMLSEAYGLANGSGERNAQQHRAAILRALDASMRMHGWPKKRPIDNGGWRYAHDDTYADSDLSITGWQLMFLRSAKNAGFEVDETAIDDAVGFVLRCYSEKNQTFRYYLWPERERYSRAMAGAGVLALAHAGRHHTAEAKKAGDWILRNGFEDYNRIKTWDQTRWHNDRYHYGILLCCQAMYQLGGEHWQQFFPHAAKVLVRNQDPDGSWAPEAGDLEFGDSYTTALATLALSAPNQLLPIFQR